MSQSQILDVLRSHPDKWFTNKELSLLLGLTRVSESTKCLRKTDFIYYKQVYFQYRLVWLHKFKP